jgi:hypothetical protein
MNNFEKSCKDFKKKYGKNTPAQLRVLKQIRKEKQNPKRFKPNSYGWSSGDVHVDYDLGLCGQD